MSRNLSLAGSPIPTPRATERQKRAPLRGTTLPVRLISLISTGSHPALIYSASGKGNRR